MNQKTPFTIGLDIGSTTAKMVVLKAGKTIFECYERHFSQVRQKALQIIKRARDVIDDQPFTIAISGSAGMGMAKAADIPFVQEVFATAQLVHHRIPDTDAVIELGGEDAKILFFDRLSGGTEERMNGSCAGGTGAFIDQMATLLAMTPGELDTISQEHTHIYTIASRCGVFAKTDIQPLLNQGANKADIAASIFQAVVDQTITGLAQGKKIQGKVLFLGGPLYFFKGLQQRFVETLGLSQQNAVFPDYALYAVSLGTAIYASEHGSPISYQQLIQKLEAASDQQSISSCLQPLFADQDEYKRFQVRHQKATVPEQPLADYQGNAYIGIDCGSTTTKLVLVGEDQSILYSYYNSNQGNPIEVVRTQLISILKSCADRVQIRGVATTGYGEELIQHAFHADAGLVETMAHLRAAQHFNPNVDFVLDIGGQDIKCFKMQYGVIDNVILNEACSSGCGSFIETFAKAMGYETPTFARLGLFGKSPVDLGSRCTVFMNSAVKQAQKEGASVQNISAGLAISVTKNAIYKVIRASSPTDLGRNIVVQGGTFLNDAILRSFELEIGREVIRPSIAGLMGAYGAALHAIDLALPHSALLSLEKLEQFVHHAKSTTCRLCSNHCHLTINSFEDNRRLISGGRCNRPNGAKNASDLPNMYQYKLKKLLNLQSTDQGMGKIGIPLGLNMFENLPFWHQFFSQLGFEVVLSDVSSRALYRRGQDTIPSDTVCYPAKLMHGHVQNLIDKGVTHIFYPCMPYNVDEKTSDNHYNCPVVAYYPELLDANMDILKTVSFYHGYVTLHREKDFARKIFLYFKDKFPLTLRQVKQAAKMAFQALDAWNQDVRDEAQRMIEYARDHGHQMIVLCGRPYHIDPEINHGIDQMLSSFGLVVLSEDSVAHLGHAENLGVLNQWTYHARLYHAAQYITTQPDMQLVQMVSFGCGIDAIASDEVRTILEHGGKLYTQLKIDEINNLGAVKIRMRSLLAAIENRSHSANRRQALM